MADPTDAELVSAAKQALLEALQAGKSVTFNGRSWTAHDIPELLEIIGGTVSSSGSSSRFAAFSKGA